MAVQVTGKTAYRHVKRQAEAKLMLCKVGDIPMLALQHQLERAGWEVKAFVEADDVEQPLKISLQIETLRVELRLENKPVPNGGLANLVRQADPEAGMSSIVADHEAHLVVSCSEENPNQTLPVLLSVVCSLCDLMPEAQAVMWQSYQLLRASDLKGRAFDKVAAGKAMATQAIAIFPIPNPDTDEVTGLTSFGLDQFTGYELVVPMGIGLAEQEMEQLLQHLAARQIQSGQLLEEDKDYALDNGSAVQICYSRIGRTDVQIISSVGAISNRTLPLPM